MNVARYGRIGLTLAALAASAAAADGVFASGSSAAVKTPQLAVITGASNQNAFQQMANGAMEAGVQYGDHVVSAAPPAVGDTSQEVDEFESEEQLAKNGIAVEAPVMAPFKTVFAAAEKRGIPVVAMDSAPTPGSGVKTFVGNDNYALGYSVGSTLATHIPTSKSGLVVVGDDLPQNPALVYRVNGMVAALKKLRPKLTYTSPYNTGANPSQNLASWQSLVSKYPKAVAYISPGDQMSVSFGTISRQTHKTYLVGTCDVEPAGLQALEQGYVTVLGDPWHFMKGYIAAWILDRYARTGKLITGWFNPGDSIITKANVKQIIAREASNATRYAWFKSIIQKETSDPSKYIKPLTATSGDGE